MTTELMGKLVMIDGSWTIPDNVYIDKIVFKHDGSRNVETVMLEALYGVRIHYTEGHIVLYPINAKGRIAYRARNTVTRFFVNNVKILSLTEEDLQDLYPEVAEK